METALGLVGELRPNKKGGKVCHLNKFILIFQIHLQVGDERTGLLNYVFRIFVKTYSGQNVEKNF